DPTNRLLELKLSNGASLPDAALPTQSIVMSNSWAWNEIVVADVNSDGADDLVGHNSTSGALEVLSGMSSLTPLSDTKIATWGSLNATIQWADVLAGDFNGDRRQDV